jgi:hypothetical protein
MSAMNQQETRVFRRPPYDARGVIVARRELVLGGDTLAPLDAIDAEKYGLDERAVLRLWTQFAIDTYPPGSKRVTVKGEPGSTRWFAPGETVTMAPAAPRRARE